MKKMILFFILSIVFSNNEGDDRTFYLNNGDKITGQVIDESDTTYDIKTSFGIVKINKNEIKPDEVIIILKSGDKITGTLIDESSSDFKLNTNFGELSISKDSVDRINFLNKTQVISENPLSLKDENRFYYGEEQLIDIWFDPVGFPLSENTLYFSGFSWAYGVSDRLQISSRWSSYFLGDLNFRPKYMIYKGGDVDKTSALSIGFDFHLRGLPKKYELVERDQRYIYYCENEDCNDETPTFDNSYSENTNNNNHTEEIDKVWRRIGVNAYESEWYENSQYFSVLDDCVNSLPEDVPNSVCISGDTNNEDDWDDYKFSYLEYASYYEDFFLFDFSGAESSEPWGEVFIAFSQSNLKKSGQGRINYNAGISLTYYNKYDIMPRVYAAIDIDARKNLKLMAEIAYDEYYVSWINRINDEETIPVHFDFGFMYTYSDNLRFGIHYQSPFIAFYYKF